MSHERKSAPKIAVEHIDPSTMSAAQQLRLAEQVGYFMVGIQRYYIDDLELDRIDTDDPPGSQRDTLSRLKRVVGSGAVQMTGLQYIVARYLEKDGAPSQLLDGLAGLLLLTKPEGVCVDNIHKPTELYEWDVVKGERGRGIGGALVRAAVPHIHPQDTVVLDVAEPNRHAIDIYEERYGFEFTGERFRHEVFGVDHLGMITSAEALYARLGIAPQ